jgi:predicted nucleic acid-binding protein
MVAYADTSFLFSLYAQDANTVRAAKIVETLDVSLVLTPLQRHELRNAFRLAAFRGDITGEECQKLLETFNGDIHSGTLVETPVAWAEVFTEAEALSTAHTKKIGSRGFDVLHVAAAAALGAKILFTFDARQKALAVKSGIKVRP